MAVAWADLVEQGGDSTLDASRWLVEHLLQAEDADRAMRSIAHQMKSARFPMHRDLAGFNFEVSQVDKALIQKLSDLSFTDDAQNAVLIGGPGTGKTHLATALGIAGLSRHAKRVRFYSTVDLVNALEQEKAQGRAGRIAMSLVRMDLVVLDELGYLPFSQSGGALLFHLLSKLYEHTSVMITSQDDHRAARPIDAPLPHHRNRQRVLPLPPQLQGGQGPHQVQGARTQDLGQSKLERRERETRNVSIVIHS